ncbi:MAG: head GIN domain-containing protein [Pseudomonadota bacterium]
MRALIKIGIGMLLLAVLLIGVSAAMLRTKGINNPASAAGRVMGGETRPVANNITTVDLDGPINLTLRQGATAALTVRGEQRLLANIDTTVDGDTLHIGTKGMLFHHRNPLRVELVLPTLEELEVRGGGQSTADGFSGREIKLTMNGSGKLSFKGRYSEVSATLNGSGDLDVNAGKCNSVELELVGSGQLSVRGKGRTVRAQLTGSGDLDAGNLAVAEATVTLLGSGNATVFASDTADLTLQGSGDIEVRGAPRQRHISRHGSGDVSWE